MHAYWLSLGLLVSCARIPLAEGDADADTDADTDSDTDTDTDTDAPVDVECGDPEMLGAFWEDHPLNGFNLTTDRPTNDAGLAAVRQAAEALTDPQAATFTVSGAIVTMIEFVTSNGEAVSFWMADSSGGLYARTVSIPNAADLRSGDIVSFDVVEIDNFAGRPQIGEVENFEVAETPATDIWVVDARTSAPLSFADHGSAIVEAYGKLLDNATDCGNSPPRKCYEFEYSKGQTALFRTGTAYNGMQNDCIQVIAPLSIFLGDLQIESGDFDWVRFY